MTQVRVVTVGGDPEHEAQLAAQLGLRGDVELVLRCVDRVELLAGIRGGGLDAIVSVGAPAWFDRQAAEEAAERAIRIVGITDDAREGERLSGFGAVLLTLDAAVDDIIESCRDLPARDPVVRSLQPSVPRGKLVSVWGSKGAPGRTSIAIELAAELSATEPETLMIDGDPYGGDILQLLGVTEELPTIVWAARMAAKEELDAHSLTTELRRTDSDGPVLLPGLPRAELWPEISDFGWRQLLTVAKASFLFTVCDVGFCLEPDSSPYPGAGDGRNRMSRTAIAESAHVVAVCRADAVGIKNFLWSFDQLKALTDADKIFVVANRVSRGTEHEVGDVLRRHLGKRPIAYVPDQPQDFGRAAMAGVAVGKAVPGSDVRPAIRTVAAALGGRPQPAGFLSRLSGRR